MKWHVQMIQMITALGDASYTETKSHSTKSLKGVSM